MRKSILPFLLFLFSFQLFAQNWAEVEKIVASDREADDWFGYSVATDGKYAIVGACLEDASVNKKDAGAAYIYEKNINGDWIEAQKLVASIRNQDDEFGMAVSISGNYAVVGAHFDGYDASGGNYTHHAGAAYIFERDGNGTWSQVKILVASDRAYADEFGNSVSISGNTIVIGANKSKLDLTGGNSKSSAGSAYIFENNGSGSWTQVQKIVASDRDDNANFGDAVSVSGDKFIVGASRDDNDVIGGNNLLNAGAAYLFEKNGSGTWIEVQKIVASDRASADLFGMSVSINNNYVVVGAPGQDEDVNGNNYALNSGGAYIFEKVLSGVWNEEQMIVASDREQGDQFGGSVSISSNEAIVGAQFEKDDASGLNQLDMAGSAYVLERNVSGIWNEICKIVPSDRAKEDVFGFAVAINGDNAMVGAYSEDEDEFGNNSLGEAGSVYFFNPNNVSVSENDFGAQIKVYPNPTSGNATLYLGGVYNGVTISVVNTLGQTILTRNCENTQTIDLNIYGDSGVYFVKVNTTNGNKAVFKILKK